MSEFGMHSFCMVCGSHRRRMPFGERSGFFDSRPCPGCGASMYDARQEPARRARVGRWPWQRGWVDRDGKRLDVPASQDTQGKEG